MINPQRMNKGYGSRFVSVCMRVCYHASHYIPCLYVENKVRLSLLWHMYCVAFFENTLFRSSGNNCCASLPSSLLNELSMNKRDSDGFFSRRLVWTVVRRLVGHFSLACLLQWAIYCMYTHLVFTWVFLGKVSLPFCSIWKALKGLGNNASVDDCSVMVCSLLHAFGIFQALGFMETTSIYWSLRNIRFFWYCDFEKFHNIIREVLDTHHQLLFKLLRLQRLTTNSISVGGRLGHRRAFG